MNPQENLKAYLDGELSPGEAAEVERALAADPALKQELEDMSRLSRAVKAFANEFQPTGHQAATDAVLGRVRAPLWLRPTTWLLAVPLVAIAFVAFAPVFARSKLGPNFAPEATASAAAPTAMPMEEAAGAEFKAKAESQPPAKAFGRERTSASGSADEAALGGSTTQSGQVDLQSMNSSRLVIKNGTTDVLVPDIADANRAVPTIAKMYGGYVESSSESNTPRYRQSTFTVKVAASNFDKAMSELGGLGEVVSSSTSGEDVTAVVADIDARLKVMRVEEQQYAEVLKTARTIGQILEVKRQLSRVRQEIESLEAQSKSLRNLAALSTISVNLREQTREATQVPQDWFGEAWVNAKNALTGFGVFLGRILVYIGAFSVVWVPALLVYWWVKRKNRPAA